MTLWTVIFAVVFFVVFFILWVVFFILWGVLKSRYARGEVDRREFEEKRRDLL